MTGQARQSGEPVVEVPPRDRTDPSGASLRAFGIGTLLCLVIGVGTIYGNCIIKGSFMAWAFSTPVALFLFFYLILANILVKPLGQSLCLSRQELTLIYFMMIVAASLPTFGMVSHLLPMITNVYYFASPENRWEELLQPHVPRWIAPSDPDVIEGFYEGLFIRGQQIPWGAWVESLCYWTVFLAALYLVSTSMMVMVRRQWIERERLLYPIMQAPIALVEEAESAGRFRVPAILRHPYMWIGFAVPALIITCNGLHSYYPAFPTFNLSTGITLFRGTVGLLFNISFSLLGFSYFINRELALGIWVFHLLTQVQQGIFNTVGIRSTAQLGWFSNPQAPYLTHQALGAMLMFALLALWRARHHVGDVFRKAVGRGADVYDGDEMMSYRAATVSLIGGLAVMVVWLEAAGIPLSVIPLFLVVAFLIFIALSRIVVEAGVALVRAPLIPPDFIIATFGARRLGAGGLTGLAYTYPWTADLVTFPMASVANGLKMAQEVIRGSRRGLFWAFLVATLATLGSAYWMFLYLSYEYGGLNMPIWWWQYSSRTGLDYIAKMIQSPATIGAGEWMFTGLGACLMWFLVTLQQRFLWWPVHPLGLAISGTVFTTATMWFNVFLAWLVKSMVLKYGGAGLYRQTRFFFLGLILGSFVTTGTWLIIDYFTGMVGNLWQYMH